MPGEEAATETVIKEHVRSARRWKQMGVLPFSSATLANWIIYCAVDYFSPLYDYFYRELLKRQFFMADEARVQVLKELEWEAEAVSLCDSSVAGRTGCR